MKIKTIINGFCRIFKFILPNFLVNNFERVSALNSEVNLHFYFEKKSIPPKEFNSMELVSKGFLNEITIQKLPLKGKFVYLRIKRRR
ncbi:ISAon1 family transposase N-terminal region protein [Flavobacterium frigidarium]